ncbi:BMP family ABC transporter substrate-binding protein [Azospirillum formosense]|uniref:BMP family lipoprotein n=1 Tax=Azospirillum formosense TaxID=861533 RepID=UPI00338DC367
MTPPLSRRSVLALGAAGLTTLAAPARAQDFAPGLLYAVGQKFDKSFNEGAFTGAEVAKAQFQRGADVVFAGAGVSNFGIFAAAKDGGRLAIEVDSNQNHLYPGTILTSILKRVDLAVERAFAEGRSGAWTPGPRALGLAERGVDCALDDHNRALVTAAMRDRLEEARAAIIEGRIRVADAV